MTLKRENLNSFRILRGVQHRHLHPGHLRPAQRQHHGEAQRPPVPHRLRQVPRGRPDVRHLQAGSHSLRTHAGHGKINLFLNQKFHTYVYPLNS